MSHDLICSWLGLEPGEWPPDHYRLLGLPPGENNPALIEQRVHERLDAVRRYQMMHPEQATEAMNRLAQAFVCLTEPESKRVYDRRLLGERAGASRPTSAAVLPAPPPALPPRASPAKGDSSSGKAKPRLPTVSTPTPPPLPALPTLPLTPSSSETMVKAGASTTLVSPPPAPAPPAATGTEAPAPAIPAASPAPAPPTSITTQPASAPAPPPEPVDALVEAGRSQIARRGLGTKRALYYRVAQTRRLLGAWSLLAPYLASPTKRIRRATDGAALIRQLTHVRTLLKGFPPLLGEAGQPGYLVLALTQLGKVPSFQSFSSHQREALSRDWRACLALLQGHRAFLRRELRALRKRTFRKHLTRALTSLFLDRSEILLVLLGLLAFQVALVRTFFSHWLSH